MLELTAETQEGTAPQIGQSLDELAREGARRMLMAALQAEADVYVESLRHQRDQEDHALVVRNGKAKERTVLLGVGPVKVRAPRVDDRRPDERFSSQILPRYMRRSPRLEEALPVLYLRGLSSGDFAPGLAALVGPEAKGLSASTITRLKEVWQQEYETWRRRSLADKDYVYFWVDGVYFNVRLEEDRLACLVVVGALSDGTKEVVALEDGYRESKESWCSLLRDVRARGLKAPVLVVGDGSLGFWCALREVYPQTREQRCWVHKIANVLDKLPKRLQARAKSALHEIMGSADRGSAEEEMARFVAEYEPRYPKATASLLADKEQLLSFYDFPAEHWRHLRTTNPVESSFATVKVRTRRTKGAGSRKAGLALAFKLILSAQDRWRKLNGAHLLPLVARGAQFKDGTLVPKERDRLPDHSTDSTASEEIAA